MAHSGEKAFSIDIPSEYDGNELPRPHLWALQWNTKTRTTPPLMSGSIFLPKEAIRSKKIDPKEVLACRAAVCHRQWHKKMIRQEESSKMFKKRLQNNMTFYYYYSFLSESGHGIGEL